MLRLDLNGVSELLTQAVVSFHSVYNALYIIFYKDNFNSCLFFMEKNMECLESGKICPNNLKCKVCKLDVCKDTIKIIEEAETMEEQFRRAEFYRALKREYPKCVNCSHLEVINYDGNVRCPYMIKMGCILKDRRVKRFGGNR